MLVACAAFTTANAATMASLSPGFSSAAAAAAAAAELDEEAARASSLACFTANEMVSSYWTHCHSARVSLGSPPSPPPSAAAAADGSSAPSPPSPPSPPPPRADAVFWAAVPAAAFPASPADCLPVPPLDLLAVARVLGLRLICAIGVVSTNGARLPLARLLVTAGGSSLVSLDLLRATVVVLSPPVPLLPPVGLSTSIGVLAKELFFLLGPAPAPVPSPDPVPLAPAAAAAADDLELRPVRAALAGVVPAPVVALLPPPVGGGGRIAFLVVAACCLDG